MPKHNNVSIGSAGEYFVAAELERRGYTVALPMAHTPNFDILAIHRESGQQVAIQVKTTSYNHKKWTLKQSNEKLIMDNMIYIFVSLKGLGQPEYHIVPSSVVAKSITESHKKWLATPGKNGQRHNDNAIRNFLDEEDQYLDKWENLHY